MYGKLLTPFRFVGSHLREIWGFNGPASLTVEDLRLELARLGLLGRPFGPDEYRAALAESLGIGISIEELPDAEGGALAGCLSAEGTLAQVVYLEGPPPRAVILVRQSLRYRPWPAYELALYHELSHLAAGHPSRAKRAMGKDSGRGVLRFVWGSSLFMGRTVPEADDREGYVTRLAALHELRRGVFEPEARKRAKWLVYAGTCPRAFEAENANRFT